MHKVLIGTVTITAALCIIGSARPARAQIIIQGDILELDGQPARDIRNPTATAIIGLDGAVKRRVDGVVSGTHYVITIQNGDIPDPVRGRIVRVIVHSDGNIDADLVGVALKSATIDVVLPKRKCVTVPYVRHRCRLLRGRR